MTYVIVALFCFGAGWLSAWALLQYWLGKAPR